MGWVVGIGVWAGCRDHRRVLVYGLGVGMGVRIGVCGWV